MSAAERPVVAFVALEQTPRAAPPDLAPFVTRVLLPDGELGGWDLSLPAVLTAIGERRSPAQTRTLVSRFLQWQRTWTRAYALGSRAEVDAARTQLAALTAGAELAGLDPSGAVLSPVQAACLANEMARAVPLLEDRPASAFRIVALPQASVLRQGTQATELTQGDGQALVFVPGRGVLLRAVGRETVPVLGWSIQGAGLRLETAHGPIEVTGSFASRVFALAPSSPQVRVELVSSLDATAPVIHALAEAANAAATANVPLLVRELSD